MDIYNLSEIETELRATADLACSNGLDKILEMKGITFEEFIKTVDVHKDDFIRFCHDGFKQAQDRIIKNVIAIQAEQELIKEKLKDARVQKKRSEISELIEKESHLEGIVILFKHCADALVWQLIHGQLYISRRLHLDVSGQKKLKEVNLESAQMVADSINSNPMNFVLITDLTNNIQVGDIVGFIDGQFVIAEIKEGKKNIEILEIINELNSNQTTEKEILDKFSADPKFLKQLQRTIKQEKTLVDVNQILKEDKGIDPITQQEIRIITPKEDTPTYSERLSALEKQLKERNFWAYDVIENCLHIGIYKGDKRFAGPVLLKAIAEVSNRPNYIIVDMLKVIESLNKPIFFLPFSVDFIFDLIFRRTKMYFMLDLDDYMELYKGFDLIAEWANKKETAKIIDMAHSNSIFTLNNRGIKIKTSISKKTDMWLSHGTLTRIFFEHINPSYMAYSTHYYIEK